MRQRHASTILAGACALWTADFASAQVALRKIVMTGDPVSGLAPGITYAGFRTPEFNDAGRFSVWALLGGSGINTTNDDSIIHGTLSSASVLLREGTAAPGAGGAVFSGIIDPILNNTGHVAFVAPLTGAGVTPSVNGSSFYSGLAGEPQLVARTGNSAPGTPASYRDLMTPRLNDAGQISYLTNLTGSASPPERAFYVGNPASPTLVARTTNAAPGTSGLQYGSIGGGPFNTSGQVVYTANLTGTNVTSSNDQALFGGHFTSPTLIAREGSAVAGTAGVNYGQLPTDPLLNNNGHVAFVSGLSGNGVNSTNDQAIISGPLNAPSILYRKGNAAHGLSGGITYASFGLVTALTDSGRIAYTATLEGPTVGGLDSGATYAGPIANPVLVARTGSNVPGVADSQVIFTSLGSMQLNEAGQGVFIGSYRSPTTSLLRGVFGYDPAVGLVPIAREGQTYDIGDGVPRTITFGGNRGFAGTLGPDGTYVFLLRFTDGNSGIFAASITLPGDLDLNGIVNTTDFSILAANFNQLNRTRATGDINGDGRTNALDFNALATNFGNTQIVPASALSATLVPEPTALTTIAVAMIPALRRKRIAHRCK